MGATRRYVTGLMVAIAGGLAAVSLARSMERPDAAAASVPSESEIRNRDIEFYQARVARDPRSARDFTQLAALYLQRARETADNGDLVQAEKNARHSLALRTGRNSGAFGVLASSLLSQHRFAEALDVSRALVAEDTTSVAARGLLGENLFELGQYDEAGRVLGSLATYQSDLGIAPRLARWAELHGKPEEARRLLRAAKGEAERRHGMPKEQLAWFHLRLGDLALRYGHLGEAKDELEAGLAIAPGDARLLAAGHDSHQSAATGARLRTMGSRQSDEPSIRRRSVFFTMRTPRWATHRRQTSTTAPWRCRSCGSPAPFTGHGVSFSRSRSRDPASAGQGGGRASYAQRHLRL